MNDKGQPLPSRRIGRRRTYCFFSVAFAVLRRTAFAATVGFGALATLLECVAAAFVSRIRHVVC
jgi:hypothetical protein